MDLMDGALLGLLVILIGVMLTKGDEIITAIRWQLSRSGREAQKTRKLLNAFYEVLYTRQEGEQGDLKLAAYLCDRGIVPEPGTFAEHGGRLGAAIALLQEKALVVSRGLSRRPITSCALT